MKILARLFGSLAAAAVLVPSAAYAVEIDGIAARVGSDAILRSQVAEELRRSGLDNSHFAEVRNDMIDRRLILKAARETKMTMQDWVVENRIREIINQSFGGDRNRLMETLARQKVSFPEWREKMKDDMVISAMRWNVIDKNASASPSEMREEYKKHPERYRTVPKVSVSIILLKPEDAGKRVEVTAALRTESFADIARKYSADSHAGQGGAWKEVKPEDSFRAEICRAIKAMPKGAVSNWIELDGWSFLVRKDDDFPGGVMSFADAYGEIERNVKDACAERMYLEWIERLRAEAYIKVY